MHDSRPLQQLDTREAEPADAAVERLGSREHPVLLRLPISHYCRKAEWGLSIAGIDYSTLDVNLPGMRHVRRASPVQRTVPVLVDGPRLVQDSHAILQWCDEHRTGSASAFYPSGRSRPIQQWEQWADEEVGPVVRRLAYRVLAREPAMFARTRPQKMFMRIQRPMFRAVARYLKIGAHAKKDDEALPAIVERVAGQMERSSTHYLFADHPTGADVATAALLEPLVRVETVWALDEHPGWQQVKALIACVKPDKRRLVSSRRIKEKDWQALEVLNQAHGALKRPTAADYP